ncbi:MAG: PH domain-containing protein [Rikenellaceae bacterium]
MKYRSRISVILFTLTFVAVAFPLLFDGKRLFEKSMVVGIVYLLIVVICLSLFFTIDYTIAEKSLIIRAFGFKMGSIDITRIKTIRRSYNPLSSPAASLNRLEIKFYSKGRVQTALISPVREEEFLKRLKEINPDIEMRVKQKRNILRFWDWDI